MSCRTNIGSATPALIKRPTNEQRKHPIRYRAVYTLRSKWARLWDILCFRGDRKYDHSFSEPIWFGETGYEKAEYECTLIWNRWTLPLYEGEYLYKNCCK
jgi:hypothetical protein